MSFSHEYFLQYQFDLGDDQAGVTHARELDEYPSAGLLVHTKKKKGFHSGNSQKMILVAGMTLFTISHSPQRQ